MYRFVKTSGPSEVLWTVMMPAIPSYLAGRYLNALAVRGLLPPLLGTAIGVMPKYGLAGAALVSIMIAFALVHWRYGTRSMHALLSAALVSLGLTLPVCISYAHNYALPNGSLDASGFVFFWPPMFMLFGGIAFAVRTVRALTCGPTMHWGPGMCINCGYLLRGSASGRCPECGEARQRGEGLDK